MRCDLVVELGGSYAAIYKVGAGLVLKQPTVVALKKGQHGYKVEAVGQEAKLVESIEDENIRVFSPFAGGQIKNFEYGQILLKHFVKTANVKSFFKKPKAVVITDIALTHDQAKQYQKLFLKAGIKAVHFVPSVFGIFYNNLEKEKTNTTIAVLDLGATHSTFAVLSGGKNVLAASSIDLGGRNMTLAVKDMIKKSYNLNVSFFAAEVLKEALCNITTFDSSVKKVRGTDASTGNERHQNVHAQEIKDAVLPYFEQIAKLVEFKLNQLSDDSLKQIKSNGILVCGQVAKTTGLERYLKQKLFLPVAICNHTENCSVLGVAKILENFPLIKQLSFKVEK